MIYEFCENYLGATPGHVIFMERPPAIPGIPQGLEYLSQIDQLLVHQQVELFESTLKLQSDLSSVVISVNLHISFFCAMIDILN